MLIILLLAALPVRSIPSSYRYQPPNQGILSQESEPEAVGTKTANAVRDFAAMMLPRKVPSDVARSMIEKVELMKDMIGPSFDRPIRDMMNDLMDSTPDDLMHGLIDPIMSSPRSQNTMEELDRQLAEHIQSEIGDFPLDFTDEVFGRRTLQAIIAYASEALPRITAAQFAVQLMLQFQVQFAPVMEAMAKATVRELVEPVVHVVAQIPDATPSEAVHMIVGPIMGDKQVALGTVDEKTAEFIEQLQNSSTGSERTFSGSGDLRNRGNRPNLGIQVATDALHQEQTDFSRLSDASQDVASHPNLNGPAIVNQRPGGSGIPLFSQNIQSGSGENQKPTYFYPGPKNPLNLFN